MEVQVLLAALMSLSHEFIDGYNFGCAVSYLLPKEASALQHRQLLEDIADGKIALHDSPADAIASLEAKFGPLPPEGRKWLESVRTPEKHAIIMKQHRDCARYLLDSGMFG